MQNLVEISSVVLEKEDFFVIVSSLFCNYLPLEKNPPSFEQTWFLFNQRCFVLSLVEIGTVVLEKIFKNFVSVYLLFRTYPPLEKDRALHLNKLESPSPKDALCLVWLKMAQRFLRRRFFFINVFLLFSNYLPLEKGRALHLKKLESPSPKNLVEIGPVVLEEKMKNVKSLRQQWRQWLRQRQWRQTNCDQKSSLEPLAQLS